MSTILDVRAGGVVDGVWGSVAMVLSIVGAWKLCSMAGVLVALILVVLHISCKLGHEHFCHCCCRREHLHWHRRLARGGQWVALIVITWGLPWEPITTALSHVIFRSRHCWRSSWSRTSAAGHHGRRGRSQEGRTQVSVADLSSSPRLGHLLYPL